MPPEFLEHNERLILVPMFIILGIAGLLLHKGTTIQFRQQVFCAHSKEEW